MSITAQQQLVIEQQQRYYDAVDRTGEHLDGKASDLLQSGSLVITIAGLATLLGPQSARTPWGVGALIAVALLFMAMIACIVMAWRPADHLLPGSTDWDTMFDRYISCPVDDAYNLALANLLDATAYNLARNRQKAELVTLAGWLLIAQVGVLLLAGLLLSL